MQDLYLPHIGQLVFALRLLGLKISFQCGFKMLTCSVFCRTISLVRVTMTHPLMMPSNKLRNRPPVEGLVSLKQPLNNR
jgi:hypothetical protein